MERLRGREAVGVISAVSPHNFSDEIGADMDLPKQVIVNDLTLREGRQIEGVFLSIDELIRIARQLEEIGVPMIQLALVAANDYEFLKELSKLGLKMKAEIFASAHQNRPYTVQFMHEQIDRILELGLGAADLAFALEDSILRMQADVRGEGDKSLDYLKEHEISAAVEAVQYATSQGGTININLQDCMRCDLDYMQRFCQELAKAGVNIITLDDMASAAIPPVYKYVFRKVKKAVPNTPLGLHVHNDFAPGITGLLGALEGGAEVLHCGINGYAEKCGHPELAQLAVVLEFLYGYDTGIKLERLTETARLIADIMRQPLPKSAPVTGENAFSHMVDFYWMSMTNNPWIGNALAPEVVGNVCRPLFGVWVGPYGLRVKAKELGISIPDEKMDDLILALLEHMRWAKRAPTDLEFRKIVEKVLSQVS